MGSFPEAQRLELLNARAKHPKPYNSIHEGYGVLAEEVAEFFDLVRQKKPQAVELCQELLQIAAVAQRICEDVVERKFPGALELSQEPAAR